MQAAADLVRVRAEVVEARQLREAVEAEDALEERRRAVPGGACRVVPPGLGDQATVDEVRDQVAGWAALGVSTLIVGAGALSFAVVSPDDVDLLAEACRLER